MNGGEGFIRTHTSAAGESTEITIDAETYPQGVAAALNSARWPYCYILREDSGFDVSTSFKVYWAHKVFQ